MESSSPGRKSGSQRCLGSRSRSDRRGPGTTKFGGRPPAEAGVLLAAACIFYVVNLSQ